jgi:hypothetical protein
MTHDVEPVNQSGDQKLIKPHLLVTGEFFITDGLMIIKIQKVLMSQTYKTYLELVLYCIHTTHAFFPKG